MLHSISLYAHYSGSSIEITATPVYKNSSSGMFQEMTISSSQDYMKAQFEHHGAPYVLAVIIIFMGFAILAGDIIMRSMDYLLIEMLSIILWKL